MAPTERGTSGTVERERIEYRALGNYSGQQRSHGIRGSLDAAREDAASMIMADTTWIEQRRVVEYVWEDIDA